MKRYDPERIFTIVIGLLELAAVQNDYPAIASLLLIILIVGVLYFRAAWRDGESS